MKREWDLIREILIEVEELSSEERKRKSFSCNSQQKEDAATIKIEHIKLLRTSGFLSGEAKTSISGTWSLSNPELTWEGHELLEKMRSAPLWERIKEMATQKGLEMTFDVIKKFAEPALSSLLNG